VLFCRMVAKRYIFGDSPGKYGNIMGPARKIKKQIHPVDTDAPLELTPVKNTVMSDFDASLENLRPEDIDTMRPAKKKSSKKRSRRALAIVRKVILFASIAVFVGCAVWLVNNYIEKKQGEQMYNEIADMFGDISDNFASSPLSGGGAVDRLSFPKSAASVLCLKDRLDAGDDYQSGSHDSRVDEMKATLTDLATKFPDLYGWIFIEGTAINYPLVQGTDNNFYLDHSPYRLPLVNGSIFVDADNNPSIMRNFNTVIYGHNLTGGGMFHDVEASFYYNEEKFRSSYIYIYTLDGVYIYEPFAVYSTQADDYYFRTQFVSTQDFVDFAYYRKSRSIYQTDVEFSATDRIITLSTCTNRETTGRYSLHAKLVQVLY